MSGPQLQAEVSFTSWDIFNLIYRTHIAQGLLDVALEVEPAVGMTVGVQLNLPGGVRVKLEGSVRRVLEVPPPKSPKPGQKVARSFQVGVQFSLTPEKRQEMEKLLNERVAPDTAVGLKRKGQES